MKDFTHIALFGGPPPALAVNAAFPAQTLQQYIDVSRSKPQASRSLHRATVLTFI